MPELPEVETVRRSVAEHAAGRTIDQVEARPVMMRRPLLPERLSAALTGRRLAAPRRRGKFLLLDVDPAGTLLIHLGMSGRLVMSTPATPRPAHTHLVLRLGDDRELRLVDPRRFGLAWWLEAGEETVDPSLARLGLEPLHDGLPRLLPPLLHRTRSSLKAALLDQRLVAGVGNIYATEALWRAGIRPDRRAARTSVVRLTRLAEEVQRVLGEAIDAGGTTIRDYAAPGGDLGLFRVSLRAYGRAGRPCARCGDTLRGDRIAGRSTVWCRRCQR